MIELLTDALAVHRLSRLVSSDLITAPAREATIRELYLARGDRDARSLLPGLDPDYSWTERALEDGDDAPKLAQLIACRWCTSIWLALGVVILRRLIPRAWAPVAKLLACSSVAGLLGVLEHFAEPQKVELEESDDT